MGGSSSTIEEFKKIFLKNEERIDEGINHDPLIQERVSNKLFNSIVRIDFEVDNKKFIEKGFFIKFSLKNKIRHFLMTCHHIIQEKFVIEKRFITLY